MSIVLSFLMHTETLKHASAERLGAAIEKEPHNLGSLRSLRLPRLILVLAETAIQRTKNYFLGNTPPPSELQKNF